MKCLKILKINFIFYYSQDYGFTDLCLPELSGQDLALINRGCLVISMAEY